MDDNRFDSLTRQLGAGSSRRSLLKGLLGFVAVAATGLVVHDQTRAARRGFSGPPFPGVHTPTPIPAPTLTPTPTPPLYSEQRSLPDIQPSGMLLAVL